MTRFRVPDMTCEGCVAAVSRAIRGIDAAARVSADLETKIVAADSAAAAEALAEAVRDAGFDVEPLAA